MIKLVIVDDEKHTREGLTQCIDWNGYGIEVVATAANGEEGIQLIKEHKPAIVISDIRMPKMDGLELAAKIREFDENIQVVFVSGYADVDLLKSAFKHEVVDYILKPVDLAELEKLIANIAGRIQHKRQISAERMELEHKLLQSMPFLREKFYKYLVSGEFTDLKEIEQQMSFLGVSLPLDSRYAVFLLTVDDISREYNMNSPRDRHLLSFSVQNVVQEIILKHTQGAVFEWNIKEFVCVIALGGDEECTESCLDDVINETHDSLQQYLKLSNTIGVGCWVDHIMNLSESLHSAQNAMEMKLILGSNRIIYSNHENTATEEAFHLQHLLLERLISALLNGNEEGVKTMLDDLFEQLRRANWTSPILVQNICVQIASAIVTAVSRLENQDDELIAEVSHLYYDVLQLDTLDSIHQVLLKNAIAICGSISQQQNSKNKELIAQIQHIIETRYSEELSITSIAQEVYLTPAYICLLFKQETGWTINKYLTNVRIDVAKKMLRTGKYKVLDVACSVGYHDQKYFSKLFKKNVGVNPSEYR